MDSGKAAKALADGWLPIEAVRISRSPFGKPAAGRFLGTQSVVSLIRGRAVEGVGPAKIELLNPGGRYPCISTALTYLIPRRSRSCGTFSIQHLAQRLRRSSLDDIVATIRLRIDTAPTIRVMQLLSNKGNGFG